MTIHTTNSTFKWIFICILVNSLLQLPAFGQKYDRMFKIDLNELKLDYKKPKGFLERDSITSVRCKDSRLYLPTTLIYSIVNKDSSIIIGFGDFITDHGQYDYDPVVNILRRKKSEADSVYFRPIVYDQKIAGSEFNGDLAVQYSPHCSEAFLKKYNNDRYILVGKKGVGEFTIAFYFTDKAKDRALTMIKNASQILKFQR